MRQRLEVRQTQQLVMTPQLRQSIEMLQMSTVELGAFVADAVERNPLLAIADGAREATRAANAAPSPKAAGVDGALRDAGPAALNRIDLGRDNVFDNGAPRAPRNGGGAAAETLDSAQTLAAGQTLHDHVRAQIACSRLTPPVRLAAEALAGELDEQGYLRGDPADVARRLGVGATVVDQALRAVQACDPTGVGARSLAECLALQLAERDRLDPAMQALLDRLPEAPETPAPLLAAACGVDLDDLRDMMAELRTLDPRPGLAIGGGTAAPVIPDVLVATDGAGDWRVTLNAQAMPRLIVDRGYAARIGAGDAAARLFISECRENASWLQRSLDQRARSILTVAAEIVRAQRGFFTQGVSGLRPMTLRQVAETVGFHESTVSRVTANKFMATPRGLIEMKFFFTAAVGAQGDGDAHSAEAVRGRIRALVDAEPAGKPLSDEHIVAALAQDGMDVARRTVAKYRESMNIPSSVARRRRARAAL